MRAGELEAGDREKAVGADVRFARLRAEGPGVAAAGAGRCARTRRSVTSAVAVSGTANCFVPSLSGDSIHRSIPTPRFSTQFIPCMQSSAST